MNPLSRKDFQDLKNCGLFRFAGTSLLFIALGWRVATTGSNTVFCGDLSSSVWSKIINYGGVRRSIRKKLRVLSISRGDFGVDPRYNETPSDTRPCMCGNEDFGTEVYLL